MDQKNNMKVVSIDAGQPVRFNVLKWTIVFLLIVGGVVANTYYAHVAWALRTAVGILVLLAAFFIALQTAVGQQVWIFAKGARVELRKVVWPTRQETIQTTLVVVAMVVFAALVLWGIDTLFFWLVAWLTGQRG
jgi:preprotein translocase subunit SecE